MNKKPVLSLLLLVFMISAACNLPTIGSSTPTPAVTLPVVTDTPAGPTATPDNLPTASGPLTLTQQTIQEESEQPQYTIHVEYPSLDAGDSRATAFNSAVSDLTGVLTDAFRQSVSGLDPEGIPEGMSSGLDASYTVHFAQDNLVSIEFIISEYMAGAAHPNPYTIVLNYDLGARRELTLADLFKPEADYLNPISAYAIDQLQSSGVLEWEDGALPRVENYFNWNITPDGLLVTFDPYTVASYAAGYHKVTIPYSELQEIIDPQGPLQALP